MTPSASSAASLPIPVATAVLIDDPPLLPSQAPAIAAAIDPLPPQALTPLPPPTPPPTPPCPLTVTHGGNPLPSQPLTASCDIWNDRDYKPLSLPHSFLGKYASVVQFPHRLVVGAGTTVTCGKERGCKVAITFVVGTRDGGLTQKILALPGFSKVPCTAFGWSMKAKHGVNSRFATFTIERLLEPGETVEGFPVNTHKDTVGIMLAFPVLTPAEVTYQDSLPKVPAPDANAFKVCGCIAAKLKGHLVKDCALKKVAKGVVSGVKAVGKALNEMELEDVRRSGEALDTAVGGLEELRGVEAEIERDEKDAVELLRRLRANGDRRLELSGLVEKQMAEVKEGIYSADSKIWKDFVSRYEEVARRIEADGLAAKVKAKVDEVEDADGWKAGLRELVSRKGGEGLGS